MVKLVDLEETLVLVTADHAHTMRWVAFCCVRSVSLVDYCTLTNGLGWFVYNYCTHDEVDP